MAYLGSCSTTLYGRHLAAGLEHGAGPLSRLTLATPPVAAVASQLRILIAGDHECLRASLRTMLELDPHLRVVGEAADDCETIKMARKLRPDVILIDLDMRCCDNFDAVAEITSHRLASAVVALTIHDDQIERSLAQAAGVNLFLEKGVPYKQLISGVRLAAANRVSP